MTDPVLDDPGELLRFWLWHEQHQTVRSFKIANLGKAIHAKAGTVGAWLTRHAIPSNYWNPIARFFGRTSYRQLEDEARGLWATDEARRGYVPLVAVKLRRAGRAVTEKTAPPVHPGTPELVQEYLHDADEARRSRQPRPPARRAGARSRHGKQPAG